MQNTIPHLWEFFPIFFGFTASSRSAEFHLPQLASDSGTFRYGGFPAPVVFLSSAEPHRIHRIVYRTISFQILHHDKHFISSIKLTRFSGTGKDCRVFLKQISMCFRRVISQPQQSHSPEKDNISRFPVENSHKWGIGLRRKRIVSQGRHILLISKQ